MYLFLFVFLCASPWAAAATPLREREPHFRPQILESDAEGNPRHVVYTIDGGRPVKEIFFYSNGQIELERDLACNEQGEDLRAHGCTVRHYPGGELHQVAHYIDGKLEGEWKQFYANGTLMQLYTYQAGKRLGPYRCYDESGRVREEGSYYNDQRTGERFHYYSDGSRKSRVFYNEGFASGKAMDWYPQAAGDGSSREGVRRVRTYAQGLLHGDGRAPALICYSPKGTLVESADFRYHRLHGPHLKYNEEGGLIYRAFYLQGEKEGEESFFSAQGERLGGGQYRSGKPLGEHSYYNIDADPPFLERTARYNERSELIEPIVEYNSKAERIRSYFLFSNLKYGVEEIWYPGGSLKAQYNYVQDELEGRQLTFYPHRQCASMESYLHGKLDGWAMSWFESGELCTQKGYSQGIPHGEHREWGRDGKPRLITTFVHGEREGPYLCYNEAGTIAVCSARYIKGRLEGPFCERYESGVLKRECTFRHHLLEGVDRSYHSNGSLEKESFYEGGVAIGVHHEYYPGESEGTCGQVARIYRFEKGQFHGMQEAFHPNGARAAQLCYHQGILEGSKVQWDAAGSLIEEGEYRAGELEGRYFQRTCEGEEIVSSYRSGKKQGLHRVFYPPDKKGVRLKRLEAHYEEGLLEGEVADYGIDGSKVASTPYHHGMREGRSALFAPDGRLVALIDYVADRRHGKAITYYPSGSLLQETEFCKDQREGCERCYFENGTLAVLRHYSNDQLTGLAQEWNREGILLFEAEYLAGELHGRVLKSHDGGASKQVAFYEQGKPVKKFN